MKLRLPDRLTVYAEGWKASPAVREKINEKDVEIGLTLAENLQITLKTETSRPKYLFLRWNFREDEKRCESVKILGDAYERGYGDLAWRGIEAERIMPWYMLVSNGSDMNADVSGRLTEGFGVKTQPAAVVTWQYDAAGVTMWADVRNGGSGVKLARRTLDVCEVVFGTYPDMSAFDAGRKFAKAMCPMAKLPNHPVYGSNNWYYAYGVSSHEEILGDSKIVAEECARIENLPYMVIDDGWQKNSTDAPWTGGNEKFPDMKCLASEMKAIGVRPGIWIRYLTDQKHEIPDCPAEWRLSRDEKYLDPSHPGVINYVKETTKRLVDWGYSLIKHDYSFVDVFGKYGRYINEQVTEDGWHFYDETRTSMEITLDFYKAVKEAAGEDTVIIGCNTISHLCAGLYELNRTGDDTSGREWEWTRMMGVNTLAMRMIQNGIFYMDDADCVGIMGPVPWEMNREWLDLLSRSGSPLFVSCKPGILTESQMEELKAAWKVNSVQKNTMRPLDWMETTTPSIWEIDGEKVTYNWYPEEGTMSFVPRI